MKLLSLAIGFVVMGVLFIFISWVFANLSIESQMDGWYTLMGAVSGVVGLMSAFIGLAHLFDKLTDKY